MILRLEDWAAAGIKVTVPGTKEDPVGDTLGMLDERIALDLCVGDQFERDHQWIQLPERLVMRPGDCVRLLVREKIVTPTHVFGQVCSKASLTAEGLLVSNIKVDPNFSGQLRVAVFNSGRRQIAITKGKPFAAVWFARLDAPLDDAPPRQATSTAGLVYQPVRERVRSAIPYMVTAAVSVGGSLAAAVLLGLD